MIHGLAVAWGIVLLLVLLGDIAAYGKSDQATVTATTRGLLSGPHKGRNFWTAFIMGGVTVYLSGWYEMPPDDMAGSLAWWACSVLMFTLMIFWALELIFRGKVGSLISRRCGILSSTIRQCAFAFSVGGLVAHFGF